MRLAKAALVGVAGLVTGLLLGYALWGLEVVELSRTLEKTNVDLVKTQAWLRDEILSSDERHEQVAAKLTKALADLSRARAQLARISAVSRQHVPSQSPGPSSGATAGDLARTGE
jgi:arginine deiminase